MIDTRATLHSCRLSRHAAGGHDRVELQLLVGICMTFQPDEHPKMGTCPDDYDKISDKEVF